MSTRLETMVQKLATRITGDAQFTAIGARVHVKKAYELAPEGVTKDVVSYHMEARAVVLALACDSDMTASNYLGDDACNSSKPCAVGQGDCDSDVDCLGGLVCGQRTFGDAMPPGVVASSDGHTAGQGDYCYNPVKGTHPPHIPAHPLTPMCAQPPRQATRPPLPPQTCGAAI